MMASDEQHEAHPITTVGALIRTRRADLGLSQTELGEACGVSRVSVGKWERDKVLPSARHRQPLAEALGVDPSGLIKEYRRGNDGQITVWQHNPPEEITLDRRDILRIARAVGQADMG